MKQMDAKEVIERLYEAVDKVGRVDRQRLRQWTEVLQDCPGEEVFNSLYSVFSNENRTETRFTDQEYAGQLLLDLAPVSSVDVVLAIKKALSTWNVSVEQFPWYFYDVYGSSVVFAALKEISRDLNSEAETESLRTFELWLRKRELYRFLPRIELATNCKREHYAEALSEYYELVRASDTIRNGMSLELWDKEGRVLAEVFYSDNTHQMTFTSFEAGLPLQAIVWLIESAGHALPISEDEESEQ